MADRFEKISDNYGDLFVEVYAEEGLDYEGFEKSIYNQVTKLANFKTMSILDIGCGDGATIHDFVENDFENLTCIDLNRQMVQATKVKYGSKVKALEANATDMAMFNRNEFDVIISGATIHNIPRIERPKFWAEVIRLNPELFVLGDKIADDDLVKHTKYLKDEKDAVKKVYIDKHNLLEAGEEWLSHYDHDEREKMTLTEIQEGLGDAYNLEVVFEMGMIKTIVAHRK